MYFLTQKSTIWETSGKRPGKLWGDSGETPGTSRETPGTLRGDSGETPGTSGNFLLFFIPFWQKEPQIRFFACFLKNNMKKYSFLYFLTKEYKILGNVRGEPGRLQGDSGEAPGRLGTHIFVFFVKKYKKLHFLIFFQKKCKKHNL